jgi:hypothetical protein
LALLFEDVVERLYRRDELMAGTLDIAGSRVGAPTLVSPMLNVINPRSTVIPPQSVVPFHAAAVSRSKALLHYHGDTGVALQHVGVLVGRNAHRTEGLILLLGQGSTIGGGRRLNVVRIVAEVPATRRRRQREAGRDRDVT